jgi:phenylacetate-CoA ligase
VVYNKARHAVAKEVAVTTESTANLFWDMKLAVREGWSGVETRQRRRLARMADHARGHSRMYGELYARLPDFNGDLTMLPPVTKRQLMARFDDWLTDPAITRAALDAFIADPALIGYKFRDRYLVFTTSGSTGHPAILLQPPESVAVINALSFARSAWPIWQPATLWKLVRGGFKAAALVVTTGHFGGIAMMRSRILARPMRARMQRAFSTLEPLPDLVAQLNAFRPVLLGGYASALALLAEEKIRGRLTIEPALVSQAGETLFPRMQERIKRAFNCPVTNSYSASESIALTAQCKCGRLHLNADWYILEPIDRDGRPVPAGTQSHSTLLTNLANTTQPIIRYDLGDRITIRPEPCACGSPLPVIDVEGRTDDILDFAAAGGHGTVQIMPLSLATVIEAVPGVYRFQAIRTSPSTLTLRIEPNADADSELVWPAVLEAVQRYLAAQGAAPAIITRDLQLPAADPRNGKFRQVTNAVAR